MWHLTKDEQVPLGKTYGAFQKTGSQGVTSTRHDIRATGVIIPRYDVTRSEGTISTRHDDALVQGEA